MKTFMRANEEEGEVEVFEQFNFEGWVKVPIKPGHLLLRVAAYVDDDRNHGLMFIYTKGE
jgi:hypothetical protein